MGGNHHVYRHIRKPLMQIYPKRRPVHQVQHINTLSGMINDIVCSGKRHMRARLKAMPDRSQMESRIKRFSRLGLDLLEHFIDASRSVPVSFQIPVGSH